MRRAFVIGISLLKLLDELVRVLEHVTNEWLTRILLRFDFDLSVVVLVVTLISFLNVELRVDALVLSCGHGSPLGVLGERTSPRTSCGRLRGRRRRGMVPSAARRARCGSGVRTR